MPGIHHFDLDDSIVNEYVRAIYNTVLLKDIVKRHSVRSVALLENVTRFLFDNVGNIFSAKGVSDYIKSQRLSVGVDTVQNYIAHITGALMAFKVPRYDIKGKRLLEIHEKYYLADVGLRHALLGYREGDVSGVLENVVYLELLRRGYQVWIGKLGGAEVDFVATRAKERIYVQVAYLLAGEKTIRREFGPLQRIGDNYPKYVLSMDEAFGEDVEGIRRLNVVDFLSADEVR
jgi:predicted AAA+ superfamily ATPase